MCVSDLWTLWETNLPHNLHPLAQSYLVQFPGLSVTATNSRRTTQKRERERDRETERERESNLWALELNEPSNQIWRWGEVFHQENCLSLFSSPLSANAPIVTHSSADTTHPLFYHPICTPILLAESPAHSSKDYRDIGFPRSSPQKCNNTAAQTLLHLGCLLWDIWQLVLLFINAENVLNQVC